MKSDVGVRGEGVDGQVIGHAFCRDQCHLAESAGNVK